MSLKLTTLLSTTILLSACGAEPLVEDIPETNSLTLSGKPTPNPVNSINTSSSSSSSNSSNSSGAITWLHALEQSKELG